MKSSFFILGQEYSSYNISIMIGIILAICLFNKFERSIVPAEKDNIISIIGITLVVSFLSAILGNKLLHFQSWNNFKTHLFQFTGMTFICGLIGGFICFTFIYSILYKSISKTYTALNIITPYFIIAQIWGRIGCLLGGCCY